MEPADRRRGTAALIAIGAPASAPPDHPLARFFAAVAEDERPLRDRLLARARSLP